MQSRKKRILIGVLVAFLIIAAVVLTVAFTILNPLRNQTISGATFERYRKVYSERAASVNPVKFIAHRGLSGEAYQNTEKAFRLAAEEPTVWGIETDVWMTSDGGIVCMHDKNALTGISNVRNVTLAEATSTPLKNNKEEYAPTIQTYLSICKEHDKVAVVELKDGEISAADITAILAAIEESGAKATIISFHYDLLKMIRERNSKIKLQALTASARTMSNATIEELVSLRCDLSANYMLLTKSVADKFHNAGLEVGIWTVNDPKNAVCSVGEFGVDYVTTDIRLAKEIAAEYC